MTIDEFVATLDRDRPPPRIGVPLSALWYDAKGNWKEAHELAQDDAGFYGSWVHAYLHRKEGDFDNADYWYRRAGREAPSVSVEAEWREIAAALLV